MDHSSFHASIYCIIDLPIGHIPCSFSPILAKPTVRPSNCQYYRSIAQNANVVGRIPALLWMLVPAGRVQVSDQGLPHPYLLPLSSHETTPQHREALLYLCDWEYGPGGWEKKRKPAKMPMCPSPNRMRRNKEGKNCG